MMDRYWRYEEKRATTTSSLKSGGSGSVLLLDNHPLNYCCVRVKRQKCQTSSQISQLGKEDTCLYVVFIWNNDACKSYQVFSFMCAYFIYLFWSSVFYILKCVLLYQELIQNAEDAHASHVKFLHDKHNHGTAKLHHQGLSQFQVNLFIDVQALHSFYFSLLQSKIACWLESINFLITYFGIKQQFIFS